MAETTLAVSFSECGAGLVVDEVDADLLAALRRAVPATKGNTRRLATLGPLLKDLEARIVDEDGNVMPARGVGIIELRGESRDSRATSPWAASCRPRTSTAGTTPATWAT